MKLSPDGLFIAIPNHDSQNAKILVISLDATEPDRAERVIVPDGMRNLNGVVWGTGGEWYVTEKTPLEAALFDVDSDGHSWELLTSPATTFAVPSLDGHKIAFPQNITSSNV